MNAPAGDCTMSKALNKPRRFRLDPDIVKLAAFIQTLSPARRQAVLDWMDDVEQHPELPDQEVTRRFKEAVGWASH